MIQKPRIPGVLRLAWPFIRRFTERVFAEDRMAVEAEQRAWEEQGEDRNHEVFPLILDLREVLRANGVPLPPRAAAHTTAPGDRTAPAPGHSASPDATADGERSAVRRAGEAG